MVNAVIKSHTTVGYPTVVNGCIIMGVVLQVWKDKK